jgi:hypothetical protein
MKNLLAILAVLTLAPGVFAQSTNAPTNLTQIRKEDSSNRPSLKEMVSKTYESLGTTATNAMDWVKKDWDKTGAWDYKLVTVTGPDAALESKLNEMGKEGWECFWVRESKDGMTLFLKKAERGVISEALKHRP